MASSSSLTTFAYTPNQIPIFDGEHYDYWSSQMKTIFISQDLWSLVEEGYKERLATRIASSWTEEKEKEYKENVQRNTSALKLIQQGVSKSIYPRIFAIKKAKDAWEILRDEFQGSQKAISIKLQDLWREFDNLAMKDNELIKDFSSRTTELINQIKSCGDDVSNKKAAEKILRSLPRKFEHIIVVIEETKDLSQLTVRELMSSLEVRELMSSLEAHEKRLNVYNKQPIEQAFQTRMNLFERKPIRFQQDQKGTSFQRRESYGKASTGQHQSRGRGRSNGRGRSDIPLPLLLPLPRF